MLSKKKCRHCHAANVGRPRGLCWRCYYTPGIKKLYQPTAYVTNRSGHGIGLQLPSPASFPTYALPGSPEKVAVLELRARLRQELWHPLDVQGPR